MKFGKLLVALAILGSIAAFFALDLHQYLNLDALKAKHDEIAAYREQHPMQTGVAFFAVYVVVTALSLPFAAVLTLAGGAIFGLIFGTALTVTAATLGATLAFLAARFLFRDSVTRRFGSRLSAMEEGVRRDGVFYLLTLRLIAVFPFFVINLAMGLTPIRMITFMWVSLLGMLPASAVYVNAGTQLAQIESLSEIVSPQVLGAFVLLGVFPFIAKGVIAMVRKRRIYRGHRKPKGFDRNLVVIGAGSAGLVAAYIAAALKAKVTLIEKKRMGGDCLYTGCVPSKALIRTARLLSHARRAKEFGMRAMHAEFEFGEVMQRVQRVIKTIEPHDSVQRYTELGVECLSGEARLTSPWSVSVDGREMTSRSIVIACGARPTVPPIKGLKECGYLTSENVWELRTLPRRLLVLGGGPIGCELAQCFARFGSRVKIIEALPAILPREDPEFAEMVAERFLEEGMELRLKHKALRVEQSGGQKRLICAHQGREVPMEFDQILVAVGRSANIDGYGLKELGVEVERTVKTDAFLRTNFPNIYACGDVAGPYQFTHTASHQAWYASVNALFSPFKKFKADYSVIPWATFTDPEVARVGLNETEAKEKNIPYEVNHFDIKELDRAIADEEAQGLVKVLTQPGKDRILGCTIAGEHAADIIVEFISAMRHGIGLKKILGTVHIYPTLSEANKYAAGAWRRAHAPQRALAFLESFHAWRRG